MNEWMNKSIKIDPMSGNLRSTIKPIQSLSINNILLISLNIPNLSNLSIDRLSILISSFLNHLISINILIFLDMIFLLNPQQNRSSNYFRCIQHRIHFILRHSQQWFHYTLNLIYIHTSINHTRYFQSTTLVKIIQCELSCTQSLSTYNRFFTLTR
jgi:hypothetical protein